MVKRSECKCVCHTLNLALNHVTPCCFDDALADVLDKATNAKPARSCAHCYCRPRITSAPLMRFKCCKCGAVIDDLHGKPW